jgi:tRNA-Thr(GGU) m(6)t(6)A37 methyltransferase TsaA
MEDFKQGSNIVYRSIGEIHTPYHERAPYQPVAEELKDQRFFITLHDPFQTGLKELHKFKYIYLLFHAHRIHDEPEMKVTPPWTNGKEVGVFASRSPVRPNPIGLSVVRIEKITNGTIFTSGLDVFDGTPLLDIKPYIKDLDNKSDANSGWIKDLDHANHLALHLKGIPH